MTTLPRRTRRRLFVPVNEHVDRWELARHNEQTAYRQAATRHQPGSYRIRPSAKKLAAVAALTAAPTSLAIALATIPIDTILAGASLISAGSAAWLLSRRATRSATEGRQNNPANSGERTRLTAGTTR